MRASYAAHGSSANLGPGFDSLAVALDAFADVVEARLEYGERGAYVVEVRGPYRAPTGRRNTAAAAAEAVLRAAGVEGVGVALRVWKGVPPGRGLGSSGASAAAAALAAAEALGVELGLEEALAAAGEGEAAAAGSPHYDNVAASLLGGVAVVALEEGRPRALSIPARLTLVVAVPEVEVPESKTAEMRRVLPRSVPLRLAAENWGRLALLVAALAVGDYGLAGRMAMGDGIVEPARAPLVPCYREARTAALEAGAYGACLSGAGPAVLAITPPGRARDVARAMEEAYAACGVEARARVTGVGGPARRAPYP